MFTLRADQVALLARNFNANQLLVGFRALGLDGAWEEGDDEISVRDPRAYTSRIKLDQHGRIAETVGPSGQRQQFGYDPRHRLVSYREPAGSLLSWTYDDEDRPTSLTRNETRRWLFESTETGGLAGIVYPDGTSSRMAYDGLGKYVGYKDRAGATISVERDGLSRVTSIRDAKGARTQYSYSRWDRPDRITYPDGSIEEHRRDPRGRLISANIDGSPWAQIAWDDQNRLKRVDYGDGHFVEFSFHESGQVSQATNPNSTVTRKYDDKGRLLEENQNGEIVDFGYDAAGFLISLTTPVGDTVRFTYDAEGRISGIEDWSGKKHTVEYEHAGRTIRRQLASGAMTEVLSREIGYPESIATRSPQGFVLKLQYQYNINGQIAELEDSENGRRQYQYDAEGRLVGVTHERRAHEQFAYDANGNRIRSGLDRATYNAADQVVAHGSASMAYDERGNLVEVSVPGGTTRYSYNGQNLLVAADLPDGRHAVFTYDAFARRNSKTVGGVTTRYIWGGDQLLCEMSAGGSRATRCDYLFLPGTHIPFALRRDGVICHYHVDALGTPRALTNESGHVVWSADYLAFGSVQGGYQTVAQPLRFPGHYHDQETGLHYNRVRYYSPVWGRYLSRDPIDLVSGLNLYTYGNNDPINEADPSGLLSGWAKFAVVALVVAVGVAAVIVAAPAVLAVAAGAAAFSAATVSSAALVVAGGAAIGAGVGLGLAPDGCLECQKNAMVKGAVVGAGAALSVMMAAAGAIGAAGAGAFALAGGGTLGAASLSTASVTSAVIGASAASTVVMMATSGGGGGASATFKDDKKLEDHFQKHGDDFGAKTADEYQQQANDFLKESKPEGVLEKVRPNGDVVRYSPKTDEFGVISKDGTIRTYYKPDPAVHGQPTNLDYFNAQ